MENLSKREQQLAVKKVSEEMDAIEQKLIQWHVSWWEVCSVAHCEDLIGKDTRDIAKLEQKYSGSYVLENLYFRGNKTTKKMGEPLRMVVLVDDDGKEYKCEFERINWEMGTQKHKLKREFSFYNNGDISFNKYIYGKVSRISMISANYNVLNNDFSIDITVDERNETNYINVSLKDNNLTVKYNNIKITEDLNTGVKIIQLTYPIEIYGDIILNPDNSISEANLRIDSNENGKLYGHYEFNISQNNGITCDFYSSAGDKFDLNNNSSVLENLKSLLSELFSVQYKDVHIIYKSIHDVMYATVQKFTADYIDSNCVAIDMKIIDEIFDYINEILNNVKGEIPLPGLFSRIDNFLSKNHSSRKHSGYSKELKKKKR